ncbi:hypothetical protein DTL42_03685 [Bremerella cremea]|uniref:Uncharacterized protein n=1 Tax=Bremerella cremea TaxID=1031537 RepID=A0A368KV35_9BACT|nr:hypothetical protein [Bremerella cremea]RCS54258.1 hypothetical protein DTL42_03685 [Bremerella cremea]
MNSYTLTAEHWQAAIEVPKEIALDLNAPLNLRLQASRMVQAMVKMILKETKDREAVEAAAQSQTQQTATPPGIASSDLGEDHSVTIANRDNVREPFSLHTPLAAATATETAETHPRYIGRAGPRKLRRKRK